MLLFLMAAIPGYAGLACRGKHRIDHDGIGMASHPNARDERPLDRWHLQHNSMGGGGYTDQRHSFNSSQSEMRGYGAASSGDFCTEVH